MENITEMNRLIIIGNGFDLAHNLPTRYEDFFLNYVNNLCQNRKYKCKHNLIKRTSDFISEYKFSEIKSAYDFIKKWNIIDIGIHTHFLKTLYDKLVKNHIQA